MNDMSSVEVPKYQPKVEQPLAAEDCLKAADATTLSRLKNLIPDKARHVLRLSAKKVALTAGLLYLLISSGCGNVENSNVHAPNISEPGPVSTPIPETVQAHTLTPAPTLELTQTPTIIPTATLEVGTLEDYDKTVRDFIHRIKSKYSIDVIVQFSSIYDTSGKNPDFLKYFHIGQKPDVILTTEEISTLEEAIATIPFCAKITDQLIVSKSPALKMSEGELDYFGGTSEPAVNNASSGILLSITEGIDLNSQTLEYQKLGIKTFSDKLKNTYFHECGHKISDFILRAAYTSEEYQNIIYPGRLERDFIREKKHPLYIPFSILEGWTLSEEMFAKEIPDDHVYLREQVDDRMIYASTNYAIEEHFAELFGLFVSGSPVLTSAERSFLEEIKEGFETNPEEFAKQVARDPMMLVRKMQNLKLSYDH